MPPTGSSSDVGGQHRAQRLHGRRRDHLGREQLERRWRRRPARRTLRSASARRAGRPCRGARARATTSRIEVRRDDQAAAGGMHVAHLRRRQHRAGADQRLRESAAASASMLSQRLRRIERHLDQAQAGLDQRVADRRPPRRAAMPRRMATSGSGRARRAKRVGSWRSCACCSRVRGDAPTGRARPLRRRARAHAMPSACAAPARSAAASAGAPISTTSRRRRSGLRAQFLADHQSRQIARQRAAPAAGRTAPACAR